MFRHIQADPPPLVLAVAPPRLTGALDTGGDGLVSPLCLSMTLPVKALRDGLLEKRSSGLLQLWKKKRCLLTEDGLRLHSCRGAANAFSSRAKELRFERMVTVDCVEYKRGLVYFTVVMATGKEIDFRCPQDGVAWNAEIALELVRFKNLQAVRTGRNRYLSGAHLGSTGEEEEEG